jgi:hypothetical protein
VNDVSYELIIWPVDHAMTVEEAIAEMEHASGGLQIGIGHDHRLNAFVETMHERYPGLHGNEEHRAFEFDVMRKHVVIAVPDSAALEVAAVVADAAWSAGVAVFDPQRHLVALPSPFGDAPMSLDGIDASLADGDAEAIDRMTDEGGPS